MWRKTFVVFYAVALYLHVNSLESKIVNTAQGPVKGYQDLDYGIFAFRSIPYATAPSGFNRFKAALPPPLWSEPLEAIDKGVICPQVKSPLLTNQTMQEDCLLLNVYIPHTEQKQLPIVVYVHGGGYQIGFGDMLVPKNLIVEHNIIAVTLNYRLGAHGFLCLGTDDIPGNAGMKDIVAALRWVKININNFGGDPDKVTIAGYSAGAAAVDLLILSKSAEGLFDKVITESGAGIAAWSIQSDPMENAKSFAKSLGFTDINNLLKLEEFYKTASFDLLLPNNVTVRKDMFFGFSPCLENNLGDEVFLDKSPVNILKSGEYRKVPIMYGFANMEGLIRTGLFETWKNDMNEKFSDFIPLDLKFKSNEEKESVSRNIKMFYFGEDPITNNGVLSYIDIFTDTGFAYPCLRSIKYHVEAGHDQIYLYEYSYVDENTPFVLHTEVKGANHGMQIVPIFNGIPGMAEASNFTKEMVNFSITMRRIWSHFIKTGTPIPRGSELPWWPAVRAGWSPHMSLASQLELRGALLDPRMRFWDQIYDQYYRDPQTAAQSNSSEQHEEL